MIAVTDEVLERMVEAIVREVDPEAIWLFGSRSRGGEVRPDSDVDLLVIEREPFGLNRSRLDEINRVREAVSAFRVPKDILVFAVEDVAYWQDSINHVISKCFREGRLLYARP
ncbi:MAG TPA: nucleotidyltransferase domain-containing protein [Phycisphaerae bacterium]|nr:nucleotidyltransferase domain-containing protein [Phycisphaerae bacterium]